jgi:sporulation protein YlmC with PRC-barrel domain
LNKGDILVKRTIVEASLIRNDTVFTRDNKKIGTIVNVILRCDSSYLEASILVFPPEQNWLETYLKQNWGKLTIDTLKKAFPAEVPQIITDIKEKGSEEAERVWNAYFKDNIQKAQLKLKKCYSLPTLAIDGTKCAKNEITLKSSLESVEAKYSYIGEPPVSETQHIAFFSTLNEARRDAESLLPIALNLTSIKGLEVQDCDGNTGCIADIHLDLEQGIAANLVVRTVGKHAGNHLVTAEDFDFSTLTCNKLFSSCTKLPFT